MSSRRATASYEVRAEREIRATAQRIFDVVDDESRFFELRPEAVAHRDIVQLPSGGHNCVQEYDFDGRRSIQYTTNIEYSPPHRFVDETRDGDGISRVRSVVTMSPTDDGTIVRHVLEVTVLVPTNRLQRALMRRTQRQRLDAQLGRLQSMAES
jgi:hypothetical protein